ncbi:MAG: hypothetical protein AAGC68_14605 [Verrucomicrobiota bacterium]
MTEAELPDELDWSRFTKIDEFGGEEGGGAGAGSEKPGASGIEDGAGAGAAAGAGLGADAGAGAGAGGREVGAGSDRSRLNSFPKSLGFSWEGSITSEEESKFGTWEGAG